MRANTCAILIGLLLMTGCDERTHIVEVDCGPTPCLGRWDGTDLWSPVHPINDVIKLPQVDDAGLWECDPSPDVDVCVAVDSNGHIGCFRDEGEWAVAVAPTCAVDGLGWLDVGAGMSAKAQPN